MFLKGEVDLVDGVSSMAFICFYLLLLWIAFSETLKTYVDRAKKLEEEHRRDTALVKFGQNAAGLVHNMRNTLSVAYGFNGMLRKEVKSKNVKKLVDNERAAFDRLSATITRILSVLRAKQETETKEVELNDFIASLVEFLSVDLEFSRGVKLNLYLCDAKLVVNVRPVELCEVIENIIRNSWEAMSTYTAERLNAIEIRTFVEPAPGFTVHDNGPGISGLVTCSNEECRRYFGIGKTTKAQGTGLGVPFVLEAAHNNGWDVTISSPSEGGAETTIILSNAKSNAVKTAAS